MPEAETDYLLDEGSLPEVSRHGEDIGTRTRAGLLEREENRHQVIRLRRLGLTYEAISLALGKRAPEDGGPIELGAVRCREIVQDYLERMASEDRESVDQLRELENLRLDHMQSRLAEKIEKGSVPAVRAALSIMERRARLNGLDAPEVKGFFGAFGRLEDIADPEAVKRLDDAFLSAFGRRGIPDVRSEGRELEPGG